MAEQVTPARLGCCGDPADCQEQCSTVTPLCVCDPEFLTLDCADIRCPTHGLAAVLRPSLEGARNA